MRPGHGEAFDVFLRRLGVGGFVEDEDLLLDGRLKLVEARVDRARIPQDLDVLERVAVFLPGEVGGGQLICQRHSALFEVHQLVPVCGQQPMDGGSGIGG